jgi:hypothetical protein
MRLQQDNAILKKFEIQANGLLERMRIDYSNIVFAKDEMRP